MLCRQMKQTQHREGYQECRVWRWSCPDDRHVYWLPNETIVYILGWMCWQGVTYAKVESLADCDVVGWCAMHKLESLPDR